MNKTIFITGTDTGVGKTLVTGFWGRFLSERGIKTITQKWIQTGCNGFSEDIEAHLKLMRKDKKDLEGYLGDVAPYVLELPASPHLAARLEKMEIDNTIIEKSFRRLERDFDFVAVEGAGGLMVPMNDKDMIVDLVKKLDLPILVVAENRLGAINQTVLTVEAIKNRGLQCAGIIFNRISREGNELILRDNPQIIEKLTGEEILGELNYSENTEVLYEMFLPIGEKIFTKLRK